jgi:carbon starvation protein
MNNIGMLMMLSLVLLALAYRFYGRFVARYLGIEPARTTPAHTINDGVDYVPTKPLVLFGHHFASIAAAGPIIGPTLAVFYGYLPCWLWLVLGVALIGAVHDFTALFVSVRQGGKSVAEVARVSLGKLGFVLYVLFATLLCILLAAAFLGIAADALTSHYSLSDLGLAANQTHFRTIEFKGATHALTGGIATTSVIVITLGAPLMGWLLYRRGLSAWKGSVVAATICLLSFVVGFIWPVTLDPTSRTVVQGILAVLCAYCFLAAWVPVWIVLQPRDFVNVHVLYAGLAAMVLGLIGCGLHGVTVSAPAWHINQDSVKALGMAWPFLFVTIACGACSGAHGLICGGTTCKQLDNERHAAAIGYGGMLMESLLGICVVLMIIGPLGFAQYHNIVWPASGSGSAVRGFALSVGATFEKGLSLPREYGTIFGIVLLEGFVLTTTDTVLRLLRYLFEELWAVLLPSPPALLRSRMFNALLAIGLTAALAFTNGYTIIWPVFGAANQLLAALTLIAAAAWLVHRAKRAWVVALPAAFMAATTIASLLQLLPRYSARPKLSERIPLLATDFLLLALAFGVVVLAFWQVRRVLAHRHRHAAEAAAGAG